MSQSCCLLKQVLVVEGVPVIDAHGGYVSVFVLASYSSDSYDYLVSQATRPSQRPLYVRGPMMGFTPTPATMKSR